MWPAAASVTCSLACKSPPGPVLRPEQVDVTEGWGVRGPANAVAPRRSPRTARGGAPSRVREEAQMELCPTPVSRQVLQIRILLPYSPRRHLPLTPHHCPSSCSRTPRRDGRQRLWPHSRLDADAVMTFLKRRFDRLFPTDSHQAFPELLRPSRTPRLSRPPQSSPPLSLPV